MKGCEMYMQNNNNDPIPDIASNRIIHWIYRCHANKMHRDRLREIENEYIMRCDPQLRDVLMNTRHPVSEQTVIDRLVHHLHNNPHKLTSLKIMDLYHTNRNKMGYTLNLFKSNWLLNTCINTSIKSQYKINKIKCDMENKQYSLYDVCHWNSKLIREYVLK